MLSELSLIKEKTLSQHGALLGWCLGTLIAWINSSFYNIIKGSSVNDPSNESIGRLPFIQLPVSFKS